MGVSYEWVAEPVDQHGDIIDPIFGDTFNDVRDVDAADFENAVAVNIALVRNVGNDDQGLQDRQYAYLTGGILPNEFNEGADVPVRFIRQIYL